MVRFDLAGLGKGYLSGYGEMRYRVEGPGLARWGMVMTYEEYINSTQWKHKRLVRLKIDKFQCRTCRNDKDLEVHHVTYDNLFNEPMEDLITLCKQCHKAITNVIRDRRYKNRTINFENEERVRLNYVETTQSEIDWSVTPDNAQRATRKPAESRSEGNKENIFQTL